MDMEMDPVAKTAGESVLTASGSGDDHSPLAVLAGDALDEKQQRATSIDGAAAAAVAASPWAFILADILGVVLRMLPCLPDRAAVRSVSRHWRAAAHGHSLPPALPLLVLPKFRFFSFSNQGAVVALHRGWMPEEVATGNVSCIGSCEGWLNVARPCEDATGHDRFLVNVFSHEIVHLPRLHSRYCTASGERPWTGDADPRYPRSLDHVVLSAPPGSATKCLVAGFSYGKTPEWSRGFPWLTLWQPGMKTWYVYQSSRAVKSSDIVFHQGKPYMLHRFWYYQQSPSIFAFTIGEDEHGVNVSGLERRVTMPPIPSHVPALWVRCNLVLWRGSLMVIKRYVDNPILFSRTKKVDVFALDLSIDPCGVTQIHSFGGDCVFVDQCRCTSFHAGSYKGVQGDCIYFIDKYKKLKDYEMSDEFTYVATAYNIRDGTVKPLNAELLWSGIPLEGNLGDPVWMFPSE